MSGSTDDFKALRKEWLGETQTLPSLGLEAAVRRAGEAYEHAREAADALRFSAWVETLRGRLAMEEEAAHALWARAVERSEWTFGKEAR